MALEKLIAESRRASVIYSHNLITFVAASKWIGKTWIRECKSNLFKTD